MCPHSIISIVLTLKCLMHFFSWNDVSQPISIYYFAGILNHLIADSHDLLPCDGLLRTLWPVILDILTDQLHLTNLHTQLVFPFLDILNAWVINPKSGSDLLRNDMKVLSISDDIVHNRSVRVSVLIIVSGRDNQFGCAKISNKFLVIIMWGSVMRNLTNTDRPAVTRICIVQFQPILLTFCIIVAQI